MLRKPTCAVTYNTLSQPRYKLSPVASQSDASFDIDGVNMRFLSLVFPVVLAACSTSLYVDPQQQLLLNGKVYTGQSDGRFAEAVLLKGSRIEFVGTNSDARRRADSRAIEIDLAGRLVLPGLIDGHVHPLRGAASQLYHCRFPFSATPDDIKAALSDCIAAQPEAAWIVGGQWDSGFFERFDIASPRKFLDALSRDKAILLKDDSLHNVWVNSKVLEIAGIDSSSADPDGGRFVRGDDNEPNGIALETAAKLLSVQVPALTIEQQAGAAAEFSKIANRYGITGAKGASTYPDEMAGMKLADERGQITVHLAASIRSQDGMRDIPLDYAALESKRERYRSGNLATDYVKIFLDGVPTPARTAAMLAPYLPVDDHSEATDGGPLLVDPKVLKTDLIELDKRGFTVKMHAAGDRSLRLALDAIEAARTANGSSGLRHEIAHAGYVSAADIPRFAALDAVADLSPILWHPSLIIDAVVSAVGPRAYEYWPVKDYIDAGAGLLAGSDWPAAVPDANPWVGIEALVTRADPRSDSDKTLWAEQAITVEQAVAIYTEQGAKALRLGREAGKIEAGRLADLIVLNQDIFTIDPRMISDTQVDMTFFSGAQVYTREP